MSDNAMYRRDFLQKVGAVSVGAMLAGPLPVQSAVAAAPQKKVWTPVSDRKIRIGIVGYGRSEEHTSELQSR